MRSVAVPEASFSEELFLTGQMHQSLRSRAIRHFTNGDDSHFGNGSRLPMKEQDHMTYIFDGNMLLNLLKSWQGWLIIHDIYLQTASSSCRESCIAEF